MSLRRKRNDTPIKHPCQEMAREWAMEHQRHRELLDALDAALAEVNRLTGLLRQ